MKSKFKSYAFWIALISGIVILLEKLSEAIGFKFNSVEFEGIAVAIIGIFVILGVVIKDNSNETNKYDANSNETNIINANSKNQIDLEKTNQKTQDLKSVDNNSSINIDETLNIFENNLIEQKENSITKVTKTYKNSKKNNE